MTVTSSAGWLQIYALGSLILIATIWSLVVDIPIKVPGKGILLGQEGVAEITLPSRGTVLEMFVKPGDYVREGDLVAVINQPDLESQIAIREAQYRELQQQDVGMLAFQKRSEDAQTDSQNAKVRAARHRITLLEERLELLQERDRNLNPLLQQGIVTRDRMLDSKAQISDVTTQISSARNEIVLTEAEANLQGVQRERELVILRGDIAKLKGEISSLRALLIHNQQVRSAYSGRVIEAKFGLGEFVEAGAPLVTLERGEGGAKPDVRKLIAITYVSQHDGKEIHPGMMVNVLPTSVESSEYGFIVGKVIAVADAPSTTAGMQRVLKNDQLVRSLSADGPPFQVEIRLETSTATKTGYRWTSSAGPNIPINSGTPCEAHFIVRESRLIGLIIPALAKFFVKG